MKIHSMINGYVVALVLNSATFHGKLKGETILNLVLQLRSGEAF